MTLVIFLLTILYGRIHGSNYETDDDEQIKTSDKVTQEEVPLQILSKHQTGGEGVGF